MLVRSEVVAMAKAWWVVWVALCVLLAGCSSPGENGDDGSTDAATADATTGAVLDATATTCNDAGATVVVVTVIADASCPVVACPEPASDAGDPLDFPVVRSGAAVVHLSVAGDSLSEIAGNWTLDVVGPLGAITGGATPPTVVIHNFATYGTATDTWTQDIAKRDGGFYDTVASTAPHAVAIVLLGTNDFWHEDAGAPDVWSRLCEMGDEIHARGGIALVGELPTWQSGVYDPALGAALNALIDANAGGHFDGVVHFARGFDEATMAPVGDPHPNPEKGMWHLAGVFLEDAQWTMKAAASP